MDRRSPDGTGAGAELRAYDTRPVDGTLPLRLHLPIGRGSKFNAPGVGDARIYVGNRDGHVLGFGNTAPVGLSGSPVDLGTVTVGSMASAPFQLTATGSVTVSALSLSTPEFTPGNVSPPLPATLAPGATLSGTVTFQPSATGLRTGALVATTGGGTFALAVSGVGRVPAPIWRRARTRCSSTRPSPDRRRSTRSPSTTWATLPIQSTR